MDDFFETGEKKPATITLEELSQRSSAPDYAAFVSEIRAYIERGLIRPMGKETNGMHPPLRSRYRIIRAKQDMADVKDEIMRLGSEFNPSGYLSRVQLYIKHRDLLRDLSSYARDKSAQLEQSMSKNERAYDIWGNEKQLEEAVCKSMLRFTGWDTRLNYYDTPEPFFDYLCHGPKSEDILILENKDIWYSLRKLFMESKTDSLLYGRKVDGLLYGEGKKIARVGALEEYSKDGFAAYPSFYYWGDLDYEGIAIYLAVSEFPVKLFLPGYMAMLEFGRAQTLTQRETAQISPPGIDRFLECFDSMSASEIRTLLEAGKYIPQEICSYPRLKAAMNTTL